MALKRLQMEYKNLLQNPMPLSKVCPNDDDPLVWKAFITGPTDTPYEGGIFEIEIRFPNDYPIRAPTVKFITEIFHANVNTSGAICMSSLFGNWKPTHSVATILLALCALLAEPNRQSAYNGSGLTDEQYYTEAKKRTEAHALKK